MLGKPEQLIGEAVWELEKLAGFPSEDVRLVADNGLKLRQKMTQLGLDPDDTTSQELYHALLARFRNDTSQIDRAIGADIDMSLDRKMDLAVDLTKHLFKGQEVWALKPTAAKQLLLALPPKKLMKLLNYRSVNSLLKREAVSEIYLMASVVESSTWSKALTRSANSLTTVNWIMQPLNLAKLSNERLRFWTGPARFTAASKLVGAVALWPAAKLEKASVLNLSLLLADAAEVLGVKSQPRVMANLHPVLNWWFNTAHLISQHGGEAVSLNLKDIALSHLQAADYGSRSVHFGQESLWKELLRRYQAYISTDAEILSKLSNQLSPGTAKLKKPSLSTKLVVEYAEA